MFFPLLSHNLAVIVTRVFGQRYTENFCAITNQCANINKENDVNNKYTLDISFIHLSLDHIWIIPGLLVCNHLLSFSIVFDLIYQ